MERLNEELELLLKPLISEKDEQIIININKNNYNDEAEQLTKDESDLKEI